MRVKREGSQYLIHVIPTNEVRYIGRNHPIGASNARGRLTRQGSPVPRGLRKTGALHPTGNLEPLQGERVNEQKIRTLPQRSAMTAARPSRESREPARLRLIASSQKRLSTHLSNGCALVSNVSRPAAAGKGDVRRVLTMSAEAALRLIL